MAATENLHDFKGQLEQCLSRAKVLAGEGGEDLKAEIHHLEMALTYLGGTISKHNDSDIKSTN